jgi:hypothetical protein
MTLVAAYRPEGVPVLVGDFLISGSGQKSSTRKKIYKVSSNLVVGWSGPLFVAAPILKALFSDFEDKTVTVVELETFFKNRPKDELSSLPFFIVGWVVTEQPYCFLWNILFPTKLFYEPYHVIGSGSEKFKDLITRKFMGGSWGPKKSAIDQAVFSVLSKVGELFSDENLERINRSEGFGHGYEVLYFDGKEFNYVENIAYFGLDILLDPKDFSANSKQYEYWYRYHSIANSAFLQMLNLRTGEMRLELILPAFNYLGKDADFDFTAGSFLADYYCIYLRLQTTEGQSYKASLVLRENRHGESRYNQKQPDGSFRFVLPRETIKFIYENVTREAEHQKTQTIRWGWGAAASGQRMIAPDSTFQATVAQDDARVVIGLIYDNDWDMNFETMEYAIMADVDSVIKLYESGFAVGPVSTRYSKKDVLGIAVFNVNSTPIVYYYVNTQLIYTSSKVPKFPLRAAVCMREDGAGISESKLTGNWITSS